MESPDLANEWLNYHHLRYFHAVAQQGSVRRASEKLSISQPSICAQVKQLEAALATPFPNALWSPLFLLRLAALSAVFSLSGCLRANLSWNLHEKRHASRA